jgi:hypothetical protein
MPSSASPNISAIAPRWRRNRVAALVAPCCASWENNIAEFIQAETFEFDAAQQGPRTLLTETVTACR